MSLNSPLGPDATPRPEPPPGPEPPGWLKYQFIRQGLRFFIGCYLRVRVEGKSRVPADTPYLLCFSHPNWVDPLLLTAFWPDKRKLFIFGPREEDMLVGWRNHLINWSHLAVPFKPSKSDLLDTTRRAMAVFKGGFSLALAGEGRLSDRDGAIVPLQDGAAYFALRAKVPIVPLAIIGTRWLRFGKRITLRIGDPLSVVGMRADRDGVARLTAQTQTAIESLLVGVREERPPGPFGRWLTDVLNERPWLTEGGGGDRPKDETG